MSNNSCQSYAVKVQGLVNDIITKLKVPSNRALIQSESIGRDNLIRDIFNGFSISLMGFNKPPECSEDIKVFLEKVLHDKPSWKGINLEQYATILTDQDAIEIIKLVQAKINAKGTFKGGRRSFKKRTTSTKRKSIKRNRSNRHRHRRTARK